MPMKKAEDFGGKRLDNKYCRYCTDAKGHLRGTKDRWDSMVGFVMKSGKTRRQAERIVNQKIRNMPAWKKKREGYDIL
jgi:hypothetical protein